MIRPTEVHETLRRSILVEGYPFVLDLDGSHGQYLKDARDGREYLDFFTFYASRPVAFDHPALKDPEYQRRLLLSAMAKPSNCDVYTGLFAEFVETFRTLAMGPGMRHLFFIDGGALAVENALKAAFDWKVQKTGADENACTQVLHFRHAFHGRSGYTLSLTNTADPRKTRNFPKFDWPRVNSPALSFVMGKPSLDEVEAAEQKALDEIDRVYEQRGERAIAAVIIEPIQCEGGDRHFRPQFLQALRSLCDRRQALLIFDEVQTGMGTTGTRWLYEQTGVVPDLVAFAKRAQTGGVMAGSRLDEVESVFKVKSRISSTFAGNLSDFVRSQRFLEIVRDDHLLANAKNQGERLRQGLLAFESQYESVTNVRGVGLLLAFDLPTTAQRDHVVQEAMNRGLLVLSCGERSVRLRPALDVGPADCDRALDTLRGVLA
ncbi:MAG: L-lysine 6-transaminase [Deltaproteobacteria bacterium]|nr:L-lysine 6-transaminase [Deltaproteobacteria bacterium]